MELTLAQASNASVTCHDSVIKGTRKDAAARFDSCITRAKESNENRRSFLANSGYVRSTLRSATVSNQPAFFFFYSIFLHARVTHCRKFSQKCTLLGAIRGVPTSIYWTWNAKAHARPTADFLVRVTTPWGEESIVPKTPQCWSQFLSTLPAKDVASTLCFGVQARSIFPHSIESMFWMLLSATVRGRFVGNI